MPLKKGIFAIVQCLRFFSLACFDSPLSLSLSLLPLFFPACFFLGFSFFVFVSVFLALFL